MTKGLINVAMPENGDDNFHPGDDACFQREAPRFQPIATAPKTGEWFLIYCEEVIGFCCVSFVGPLGFGCWDSQDQKFIVNGGYTISEDITHWAPFPIFPTAAQGATISLPVNAQSTNLPSECIQ